MSIFYKILIFSTTFLVSLVPALIAEESASAQTPQKNITFSELREAYIKVNGGRMNIESIQSIISTGRVIKIDEDLSQEISFRIIRKRPGMLRQKVTYPSNIVRKSLVNSEGVWIKIVLPNKEERVQIPDKLEKKILRQMARMESPFMQIGRRSEWVELKGLKNLTTPNGKTLAYHLKILPKSGLPYSEIWLDAEHYHEVLVIPSNTDTSTENNQMLTYYSDYKEFRNIYYPSRLLVFKNNRQIQTIFIDEFRTNIGVFDHFFSQKSFLDDTKPATLP